MPTSFRRSLPITGVAVMMTGAPVVAATHATPAPRVRAQTPPLRALLDDLIARSATARGLVETLQRSDTIVYVRHRRFTDSTLDGRTGLVRSNAPTRFVIIEIACDRSDVDQQVTLAHELRHAVEIAGNTAIVDAASLAAHFGTIGRKTAGGPGTITFETGQAQYVAARVRRELFGRSTHDRD